MSRSYEETQFGDLDALVIEGDDNGPLLVICHGYGADAYDLLPLNEYLGAPDNATWVFPQGPEEVPIGPHMSGRAWFQVDLAEFERAMMMGVERDLSDQIPGGLAYSRQLLMDAITKFGRPWSQIILGGFSQGAMLTTDVTFQANESPRGLVCFSGAPINVKEWQGLASRRAGMRFFQSHGRQDQLLGFKGAQKLEKIFLQAGMKGQLLPFDGGHEIPPQVIQSAASFIRKTLA